MQEIVIMGADFFLGLPIRNSIEKQYGQCPASGDKVDVIFSVS